MWTRDERGVKSSQPTVSGERYQFTYLMAPGHSCADLIAGINERLHSIGIEPDFQIRDAGGYFIIRLLVPAAVETAAAFRLISFNRYMASQGLFRQGR